MIPGKDSITAESAPFGNSLPVDLGTDGEPSDGVLWGDFVDGPTHIALSSDGDWWEFLAEG